MTFTTVFPLEDGPNCEPCGFHVLRILAKIDPYVETFPKFYTHILRGKTKQENMTDKGENVQSQVEKNPFKLLKIHCLLLLLFCFILHFGFKEMSTAELHEGAATV